MRRVDELRLVAQPHRRHLGANDVLTPPIPCTRVIGPRRSGRVAHALHHDQPARAHSEHVVANALGRLVPVRWHVLAPRACMRLILQVGREHVPLRAELVSDNAPGVQDLLLTDVFVVPEPGARPRSGRGAMAREHHQNPMFGRVLSKAEEHLRVRQVTQSFRLVGPSQLDCLFREHRLVVEREADGVEALFGQEVHVPARRQAAS